MLVKINMYSLFSQGFRSCLWKHLFSLFKTKERIDDGYKVETVRWDRLPAHIWDLIFQRLPLVDRVRASVVCKHWSSALNQTLQPVWMLLLSRYTNYDDKLSFFDLSENTIGKLKFPSGANLFGASKGWLKLQFINIWKNNVQLFLLDPISGVKISLPPLSNIIKSNWIAESTLDQFQISSKDASEFVVAVTFDQGKILAVCKPHDNTKWTLFKGLPDNYRFTTILFCEGILYAFVVNETELEEDTFQFQTYSMKLAGEYVILKLIPIARFLDIGPPIVLEHPIEEVDFFFKNYVPIAYMVESNGELLIVVKILEVLTVEDYVSESDNPPPLFSSFRVERFQVFKVEASDHKVLHVTRLNNLDNRTLFIHGEDSLSITGGGENFSKNCIYFLEDENGHHSNMISRESGVFHLDDGRIERLFPSLDLAKGSCNWWFFPNIKIGGFN